MSDKKGTDKSAQYDVIIVGGGPAGLFAAYFLSEYSDRRVLLVEKGKSSLKRNCPINTYRECIKCKPCNILSGIGGAGLFSDGKLNYIYKLGKTDLSQFMPIPQAEALIDETEQIFNAFGMDGPVYPTDGNTALEIRKAAKRYGIDLLIIKQKHLGSDRLPDHITALADHIKSKGVVIHTSEEVKEVMVANNRVTGVVTNRKKYAADNVILTNIIEGLEKLNHVVPGVANDETLLYAPEIKFFATQVETTSDLETKIKGMYVAGDGPGVAGNIVSASATGLIPAKAIIAGSN